MCNISVQIILCNVPLLHIQWKLLLFNVLLQLSFLTLPKNLFQPETSGGGRGARGEAENQYL